MAQTSTPTRSPLGLLSVLIPPALIILLVMAQKIGPESVAGRLIGVTSLFGLGVGFALGVSGINRSGSRSGSAILGILLNGLMFVGLAFSVVKPPTAPTAAPEAAVQTPAPDPGRASDK